jgi:hypothetical protein
MAPMLAGHDAGRLSPHRSYRWAGRQWAALKKRVIIIRMKKLPARDKAAIEPSSGKAAINFMKHAAAIE